MTRRESREAVFTLLFEAEFNKEKTADEIMASAKEVRDVKINDYIVSTFRGVLENIDGIDELISANADNWKISRMSAVVRSLLRLCVYEMLFGGIPPKAAINEAVELAKKFDDASAPSFVNGILNKIAHKKGLIGNTCGSEVAE